MIIAPHFQREIVELAKAGNPPRQIVVKLGHRFPAHDVTKVVMRARNGGEPIPLFRKVNGTRSDARTIIFSTEVLVRLGPHARKRNTSVNALIRRLIDDILDDNLVDAVLDDGGEASR
jgi:hypothetical protein